MEVGNSYNVCKKVFIHGVPNVTPDQKLISRLNAIATSIIDQIKQTNPHSKKGLWDLFVKDKENSEKKDHEPTYMLAENLSEREKILMGQVVKYVQASNLNLDPSEDLPALCVLLGLKKVHTLGLSEVIEKAYDEAAEELTKKRFAYAVGGVSPAGMLEIQMLAQSLETKATLLSNWKDNPLLANNSVRNQLLQLMKQKQISMQDLLGFQELITKARSV